MPHRCVRCGKIYDSVAKEILEGCTCGSHYFFFFKQEDVRLREQTENLTSKEREEILEDVKEMVGEEPEIPVVLDLESIRVRKAGKFDIDIVNLFKRRPVVYKLEDGKYLIDIPSTFQLMKHKEGNVENDIKEQIDIDLEDQEAKEDKQDKEDQEKASKKVKKKEEKIEEEYVEIPKNLEEESLKEDKKEIEIEDLEKQEDITERIKDEI